MKHSKALETRRRRQRANKRIARDAKLARKQEKRKAKPADVASAG